MSAALLVAALAAGLASGAGASSEAADAVYKGAGIEDEKMPVKVLVTDGLVEFKYSDVRVSCSDGSSVRQGGVEHSDRLNDRGRFKDIFEAQGVTSILRGEVALNKAVGKLSYDLVYEGGECHSGEVDWKARRK